MKNNITRLVMAACVIGFAFVLGSAVQVKADTDITDASAKTVDGSASVNYVNKDVYKISLPTDAVLQNALTYQVDPQGLVEDTSAIQFGSAEIGENAGVYFKNLDASGTVARVSGTSDPFVITNKSSSGVTLGIDAKLVPAAADKYAGGYSTTKDFSGTDSSAGLYFGLIATGELDERSLSETVSSFSGVAISASELYGVTYDASGYKYDITDPSATNFPTFEFTLEGALNHDVADTTWMTKDSSGTVTTKGMPTVQLKYTPAFVADAKPANIIVDDADFYVSKTTEEGGFGTTKPSAITVNGKTISSISENVDGYIHVTWNDICKAYGKTGEDDTTLDEERVDAVYGSPMSFKLTWGGTTYYGESGK